MDPRPPKRRALERVPSISSAKDQPDNQPPTSTTLSSRPKRVSSSTSTSSTRRRQPSPKQKSSKSSHSHGLHSFFEPASEGQRWSSQKFEQTAQPAALGQAGQAGSGPGPGPPATLDADIIEDDYDSYDEIFSQHIAGNTGSGNTGDTRESKQSKSKQSAKTIRPKPTTKPNASKRSATTGPARSKRFLMPSASPSPGPGVPAGSTSASTAAAGPRPDSTPWFQRFAPNLDELAVHKRKVSDVQKWLNDVFEGKRREVSSTNTSTRTQPRDSLAKAIPRSMLCAIILTLVQKLLVLRGPAGCGKTTTISLLSKVLNYDIIEWRNPSVPEYSAAAVTGGANLSASAQFDEFLARGDRFGGLDLEAPSGTSSTNGIAANAGNGAGSHRILLIEEFPTVLSRNSSSLASFRTSLQRYLASTTLTNDQSHNQNQHPPIVMIVSETLLSTSTSSSENLTVHRLLGPILQNHPGTTIIDFNSIATTFMAKALRTVLEKESRFSKRIKIPGPAALAKIAEIGDIRSAISSLEFLCLKTSAPSGGGSTASADSDWGGSLKKKPSRSTSTSTQPLTAMEEQSLKLISQRESSLGMFHAVGKIVYNKRLDPSLVSTSASSTSTDADANANADGNGNQIDPEINNEINIILPNPPPHLSHNIRKTSQVSPNTLIDETGTDISTFISALHENYPPSCSGTEFTNHLNDCIDALSDCDILASGSSSNGNRGGPTGGGYTGGGAGAIDKLRQEEISFQVACRGILFGLPYPVKRRLTSGPSQSSGGPAASRDAHKMLYPSSLRLWRKIEEIEGLVDSWMVYLMDRDSASASGFGSAFDNSRSTRSTSTSTVDGVQSWRNRLGTWDRNNIIGKGTGSGTGKVCTMMRREDVLLYQLPYMAQIRQSKSRSGHVDADQDGLREITSMTGSGGVEDGDEDDDEFVQRQRNKEKEKEKWKQRGGYGNRYGNGYGHAQEREVEIGEGETEEKLILSDDDIVD